MSGLEILTEIRIFQGLGPEYLDMIASISRTSRYNIHDMIFEEGTLSSELYIVVSGEVDILITPSLVGEAADSMPVKITTLRRGQSFGEMALVDYRTRAASARCGRENTQLLVIPREALINLCETHLELGYLLMRNLAIDLAGKIRTSDMRQREWLVWSRGR